MADAPHRPGHRRILPHELLDRMKQEIAATDSSWEPDLEPDLMKGRLGGRMVKVTIPHAEESLAHGGAP